MSKKIGLVIPYFNDFTVFDRTFTSILKQKKLPDQIIIIDDCSEDSVLLNDYIEEKKTVCNISIKLIRNNINRNASYSRNLGILECDCDYIALLDADDFYDENHLFLNYEFMVKNKCDFIYSNIVKKNDSNFRKIKVTNFEILKNKFDILFYSPPQTNSFFFNKKKLKEFNIVFNENLRRHQDWDFLLSLFKSDLKIMYLDIYTSYYCVSHRSYKSRVNYDSMFMFWSNNYNLFTREKVNKYILFVLIDCFFNEGENKCLYYIGKYNLKEKINFSMLKFLFWFNENKSLFRKKITLFMFYCYFKPSKFVDFVFGVK